MSISARSIACVKAEKLALYWFFTETKGTFRDRLAAGRQTLNLETGVRIPVPEPRKNIALQCSRGFAKQAKTCDKKLR